MYVCVAEECKRYIPDINDLIKFGNEDLHAIVKWARDVPGMCYVANYCERNYRYLVLWEMQPNFGFPLFHHRFPASRLWCWWLMLNNCGAIAATGFPLMWKACNSHGFLCIWKCRGISGCTGYMEFFFQICQFNLFWVLWVSQSVGNSKCSDIFLRNIKTRVNLAFTL